MMEVKFNTEIRSPEDFKSFFQKEKYENFLKDLLNRSKYFPQDIEIIKDQSNSEYDYYSKSINQSFEATLLANNKLIQEIIKNPDVWYTQEFSSWIIGEAKKDIIQSLDRKKNKNNIIIFNIFPMGLNRLQVGTFDKFALDDWDLLMIEIKSENSDLVSNKNIYLVSYNFDDTFLLKQLNPDKFLNENIPFYDRKNIFPIRIKKFEIKIFNGPSPNTS